MTLPADAHRKLRAARAYAGIEQRDIAEELGYSRTHWGSVEAGRKGLPDKAKLERAMELCGVPYAFLEQEGFAAYDQPAVYAELERRFEELRASLAMFGVDLRKAQQAGGQQPAAQRPATPPAPSPREVLAPGLAAAADALRQPPPASQPAQPASAADQQQPPQERAG